VAVPISSAKNNMTHPHVTQLLTVELNDIFDHTKLQSFTFCLSVLSDIIIGLVKLCKNAS